MKRLGILAGILLFACQARAQPTLQLGLDLVGVDPSHSAHLVPMAETMIVTRNDAVVAGGPDPADKLDLVFGPSIWTNKAVLAWLAGDSSHVSAILKVTMPQQRTLTYTLTGISLRSLTVSAQGGEGQASFIVGAAHLRVDGLVIN